MTTRKSFLIIPILTILVMAFGCNDLKENRFDYSYNADISKDFLQAEGIFNSLFRTVLKAGIDTNLINTGFGIIDSANVGRQGNSYNFLYSANKLCPDGSRRSGGFSVSFSGPLFKPEATASITFNDLVINQKLISGTFDIENVAMTNEARPVFVLTVNSAEILIDEETDTKLNWTAEYTYVWKTGYNTLLNLGDDLFIVGGTSFGRGKYADRFNTSVSDSMNMRFTCNYLRGGKSVLRMPDFEINQANLDYLDANICSGTVKAVFTGKTPNGNIQTSENTTLSILL